MEVVASCTVNDLQLCGTCYLYSLEEDPVSL